MTKEKRIVSIILIFMIALTILPKNVKATDTADEGWTDFTNAKLEIIPYTKNISGKEIHIVYKIKATNVKLDPESYYWIYFHKKDDDISASKVRGSFQASFSLGGANESRTISLFQYILEKNDDIYVSIAQTKDKGAGRTELVVESRKIERPKLLPEIGNRVHMYFGPSATSTYYWAPHNSKLKRILNIKIGKITDSKILIDIKDNKADGLQNLLSYAKKQGTYNYTGSVNYENGIGITEGLTSKMKLEPGSYYFAYIVVDDENGTYYPVEDIALYYARNTTDLVRYPKEDFVWNLNEENKGDTDKDKVQNNLKNEEEINAIKKDDNTQAKKPIPQTGENIIYIVSIIGIVVLTIIGYRKFQKYKDLK